MKLRRIVPWVGLMCWVWLAPAHTETLLELWRSPFGLPRSVSADPTDGTCWAATGSSVMHIDAEGAILSQSDGFWNPQWVSANPTDGTCWVADTENNQVAHLDADGEELLRLGGFARPSCVAVNPTDGSCWITAGDLIHIAEDGTQTLRKSGYLARQVAVNASDGSCWVAHEARPPDSPWLRHALTHLAPDGTQLWRSFDFGHIWGLAVNRTDGSCWIATVDEEVVHLSESGEVLWQSDASISQPRALSVNHTDSSCWVAGQCALHLAADGTELFRGGSRGRAVSVNVSDGSCWIGGSEIVRLQEDGTEVVRRGAFSDPYSVSVHPEDGSCWVAEYLGEVWHLAEDGTELWRGSGFDHAMWVSVNPTDGSCWVAELGHDEDGVWVNSAVVHLAVDGTELWRGTNFAGPRSVSVNPSDGSCWVADSENHQVVHLADDGTELWRGGSFDEPWSVSVNSADGSCWVADRMNEQVVHLSESGDESARISGFAMAHTVSVDPSDGSCWAAPGSNDEVVHLGADGELLWAGGGLLFPQCVAVDPSDGSCWVTDFRGDNDAGLLVHIGQAGQTTSQIGGYYNLYTAVSVGDEDDAIWVADQGNGQVVRLRTWFDDVPRSHWAFEAILACVDAGVVAGYPDDTYRPSATVTRDQMAVYIARALARGDDGVPDPGGDPTFPDVLTDFWAYRYVEHVAANNVVAGYDDGLYHPEYSVDRAQMAVYVARALVAPTGEAALADYVPADPRNFPDVAETYWAYKHIEYSVENGVVQGYDDGNYRPQWLVTRDQMAVYVARAFGLVG